tara:strand:- start:2124 stop:2456 length:333 start_codon:yes stop_codon:yes gene_type:complete
MFSTYVSSTNVSSTIEEPGESTKIEIKIGQIWRDTTVPKSSAGLPILEDRVKIIDVSDSNIVYAKRYDSLSVSVRGERYFEGELRYPTSIWGTDQKKTISPDEFLKRFVR